MNLAEEAAMRSRMQARGALVNAAMTPAATTVPLHHPMYLPSVPFIPVIPSPATIPVIPSVPTSMHWNPNVLLSEAAAATATAPAAPLQTVQSQPFPSSVQTMDRCKSLKERIYDRMSSTNQSMDMGSEPTKDIYAHAAPFPPSAVYEVERVHMVNNNPRISPPLPPDYSNPNDILRHVSSARLVDWQHGKDDINSNHHSKGVLLMATECAEVVRGLQNSLEAEKHRVAELENALWKNEVDLTAAIESAGSSEKARQQWAERHAALDAVYQMEKRQWAEFVATERHLGATASTEMLNSATFEHRAIVEATQHETNAQRARADRLQADCDRLDHILRELKEQMSANSTAVTTSSSAVDKLTRELLLAKQQATFISTGYKKQDGDLRSLRQQLAAQAEELARLRAVAAEHSVLVAQRNDANARLEAMHVQVAENPALRAELTALKDAHSKLTIDFESKSARAAELKDILDEIRNQANDAYLQTKGFNNMAEAMSPARMGGDPTLMGLNGEYHAYTDAHLESLRREIELERQRAEDEKRRWRERLDGK